MARPRKKEWAIFSNHGIVLFHVVWHPDLTAAEIALAVGLSERWVRKILEDLETAGMVRVTKHGVQNSYAINPDVRLRHPTMQHLTLRDLLPVMTPVPEQTMDHLQATDHHHW
ncbi:MAG: winged helix-turn-helix transcriptional regulator [Chloroflexi bacterium]|nr:winged helix-turn-helix transcriptional regulator [Chloroflexota bacterium]